MTRGVAGVVEVDDDHVWVDPARTWSRRGGWVAAMVSGACLVVTVLALAQGANGALVATWALQVLAWGGFALQGLGRWGTLVDGRGVHRPWRRVLVWSRVASMPSPTRFDQCVRLRLTDGRIVGIGVPAAHVAAVARIGAVPVEGGGPVAGGWS